MVLRQAFAPTAGALQAFLEEDPRAPEAQTRKEKGWERSSQPEAEGRMITLASGELIWAFCPGWIPSLPWADFDGDDDGVLAVRVVTRLVAMRA